MDGEEATQLTGAQRRARQAQFRAAAEVHRRQLEELLSFLENDLNLNDADLDRLIQRRRETGMSNEQIDRLESTHVTDDLSKSLSEECCSICLDSFGEGLTIRKLASCHHVFHQKCIDEWLARKGECPNCKRNLRTSIN